MVAGLSVGREAREGEREREREIERDIQRDIERAKEIERAKKLKMLFWRVRMCVCVGGGVCVRMCACLSMSVSLTHSIQARKIQGCSCTGTIFYNNVTLSLLLRTCVCCSVHICAKDRHYGDVQQASKVGRGTRCATDTRGACWTVPFHISPQYVALIV